jgi:peptidase A4-like protein
MSTSSLRARVRTFMGKVGKHRSLRAGVASLAAGALALVAACGGGAGGAGAMTRVSRGLEQGGMFETGNNWAGYVIKSGHDVDAVSGVWTVPKLNCQQTPNALVGAWAGIGGVVRGQALLQTGVGDSCSDGVQHDQAWWELADTYKPVYFSSLLVLPGDEMQASVYDRSGQWVTRIDNLTTGWSGWMLAGKTYGVGRDGSGSFTVEASSRNISYAGGSTVEWVVEAPGLFSTGSAFQTMPDFGTVRFSDLRAGLQSWSLNPDEVYEISYDGRVVAAPGAPIGDGFWVSYTW